MSIFPNRSSPFSAFSLAPSTLSSIHLTFVPEKYASTTRPVFSLIEASKPFAFSSSHIAAVLLHCHTMALYIGFPVFLSQTTVVSLWFVIPIAATSSGLTPVFSRTSLATPLCVPQISMASCSTHPAFGYI